MQAVPQKYRLVSCLFCRNDSYFKKKNDNFRSWIHLWMADNIVGVGRTEQKEKCWLRSDHRDCEWKHAAALDTAQVVLLAVCSLAEGHWHNGYLDSNDHLDYPRLCSILLVGIVQKWTCCKIPKSLPHYYMPFKTKFFLITRKDFVNIWVNGC